MKFHNGFNKYLIWSIIYTIHYNDHIINTYISTNELIYETIIKKIGLGYILINLFKFIKILYLNFNTINIVEF